MPQSDHNCLRSNELPSYASLPGCSNTVINHDVSCTTTEFITSSVDGNSGCTDGFSATSDNNPRNWIPDVESSLIPRKGHVFQSLNQAFEFYSYYGKVSGFDIKLGTEKNYHGTDLPNIKYFNCNRGGKRPETTYDNHKYDFSVCSRKKAKSIAKSKGKGKVDACGLSGKRKYVDISDDTHGRAVLSEDVASVDVSGVSGNSIEVGVCDDISSHVGISGICNNGGLSNIGDTDVRVHDVRKVFRKTTSFKTGCLARMMVRKLEDDNFEVYGFEEKHNHPLVSQENMQFMMGSRDLGYSKQQFLLDVSNANVGPVKAFKLMKEMCGGFENVGVNANDCKNFRRDLNAFIGDRDAQMVVEKLENLEKRCDGFFMDYCQAPDKSLCGLFWADKMAKINYQRFGDTISFDATFRSNKYRMVFVPFTGIDNHNRSVTLGAGLLSDETVLSYKWLLQSFKKAFSTDPQVVVTDQDPSMKQAIEAEFPNARHRYCMWHIMQKLATKVGSSICNTTNFKERFCRIVWSDRISINMFEEEWASIMKDFDLCSHKWLSDLYDMRHRWIPAFLRDEDMSGLMRTTSRSESENCYFNRFTNPDLTLVEFIGHFESAMDIQRYNQKKHDHESRYNRPDFQSDLQLEKDAAELFTHNIFYEIQDEIVSSITKCMSVNIERMGVFDTYFIQDFELKKLNDSSQYEIYEVSFYPSTVSTNCSCKRYELYGIVCRHIFYVWRLNNIKEFPSEYVLDRWAKSDEKLWVNSTDLCESSSSAGVRAIRRIVEDTVDRLVPFKDKLDAYRLDLSELLMKAETDVPVLMRVSKKDIFCSMLGVDEPESVPISNPWRSKNKGTGSHTRWKNREELIQNAAEASNKMRTCFVCFKKEGHNSRTCPYKAKIIAENAAKASTSANVGSDCNKRTKRTTRSSDVNYKE